MGKYVNETDVMLLGQAADRGDAQHVLDHVATQGFFWELEMLRGLAYKAGVPVGELGITEDHAQRLAAELDTQASNAASWPR